MNILIINFQSIDCPDISEISALCKDLGHTILDVLDFKPHNKKFLGKGQMENIQKAVEEHKAEAIVYNGFLSGLKYKLLEKYVKSKIYSRVDIIIQVFENRAQTLEGRLQVKLASLLHQRSKVVRAWSHLERQRGGGMTIGGPGEKQLELDKRMIGDKILAVKKQLAKIEQDRKTRSVSRTDPIISLIGYSNAGKTTLFNLLTKSNCNVSSKPFETLDPYIRPGYLLNDQKVLFSDTVGFVTNLPPFLIKAFRATLEQILHADILVCVHDSTNENNIDEIHKWLEILKADKKPIIYTWNKYDLLKGYDLLQESMKDTQLEDTQLQDKQLQGQTNHFHEPDQININISCKTNFGIDELKQNIEKLLNNTTMLEITLDYTQTQELSWLMKNHLDIKLDYQEDQIMINAKLENIKYKQFMKQFSK